MIETREVRVRRSRLHVEHVEQHRVICSCGERSQWSRRLSRARASMAGHALDGQQQIA